MNQSTSASNEVRSPIIASWILLIGTCVLAIIPVLGFLSWPVAGFTCLIAIILGIVAISKGGTWSGIFVLVAALVVVPVFVFISPFVTTAIFGAAVENAKSESGPMIEINTEDEAAEMSEGEEAVFDAADETEADASAAATDEAEASASGSATPRDTPQ